MPPGATTSTRDLPTKGADVPLRGRDRQPRGRLRGERFDPEPRRVPAGPPRRDGRTGQRLRRGVRVRLPGRCAACAVHHDLAGADRRPARPTTTCPGNPHYDWLANTIDTAHAAGIPWVIVGMHFPCLTAGQYTCAAGPPADEPAGGQARGPGPARARAQLSAEQAAGDRPHDVPEHRRDGLQPGVRRRRRPRRHLSEGRRHGRCDRRNVRQEPLLHRAGRTPSHRTSSSSTGRPTGSCTTTDAAAGIDARSSTWTARSATPSRSSPARRHRPIDRAVVPRGLVATPRCPGTVVLSWAASTDDAGIRNYIVSVTASRSARRRRPRSRCVGHLGKHLHVLGHGLRHRGQPLDRRRILRR